MKKILGNFMFFFLVFVSTFILVSCNSSDSNLQSVNTNLEKSSEIVTNKITENTTNVEPSVNATTENIIEEKTTEKDAQTNEDSSDIEKKVQDIMSNMTLEEKIGQMFIVAPEVFDTAGGSTVTYDSSIGKNISKYNVGGIILFASNIQTPEQTKKLISGMQSANKTKMFIAVDEEGGVVSRIAKNPKMGTTRFPSMSEIGATEDPEKAYNVGNVTGREIKELGFNVNFAPVADVITNKGNYEICKRSFGTNAKVIADMVGRLVEGLHNNNICSTLKHFPGQGSYTKDTHIAKGVSYTTLEELRSTEFLPFKKGIEKDTDFVMISHVSFPKINDTEEPSSLSENIITNLLINELNYKNIIISDSFQMKAVTKYNSSSEATLKFVKAGGDIILMPENFKTAYNALLNSVKEGNISEERINTSVRKILNIKVKRGII